MGKKLLKAGLIIAFLVGFIIIGRTMFVTNTTPPTSGSLRFDYSEVPIRRNLNEQELSQINNCINNKLLVYGISSTDYGRDISMVLTDSDGKEYEYWFASDGRSLIYTPNRKGYIIVPQKEYDIVLTILRQHGFFIPCY